MFSYLIFSTRNLGPEVGMAPCVVLFYRQIETEDICECRIRDYSSNSKKNVGCSDLPFLAVDAEKDNQGDEKWLNTMIEGNPSSSFVVFVREEISSFYFLWPGNILNVFITFGIEGSQRRKVKTFFCPIILEIKILTFI